jgi:hypothetical protein
MTDDLSHLDKIAKRYDLTDPEDRANFRGDVAQQHKSIKMSAINQWLGTKYKSRDQSVRALADTYIKRKIG